MVWAHVGPSPNCRCGTFPFRHHAAQRDQLPMDKTAGKELGRGTEFISPSGFQCSVDNWPHATRERNQCRPRIGGADIVASFRTVNVSGSRRCNAQDKATLATLADCLTSVRTEVKWILDRET